MQHALGLPAAAIHRERPIRCRRQHTGASVARAVKRLQYHQPNLRQWWLPPLSRHRCRGTAVEAPLSSHRCRATAVEPPQSSHHRIRATAFEPMHAVALLRAVERHCCHHELTLRQRWACCVGRCRCAANVNCPSNTSLHPYTPLSSHRCRATAVEPPLSSPHNRATAFEPPHSSLCAQPPPWRWSSPPAATDHNWTVVAGAWLHPMCGSIGSIGSTVVGLGLW